MWDRVYATLHFKPNCHYRGHSMTGALPFEIALPHSIYAIEAMTNEQLDLMDDLIGNCLAACTDGRKEWYALDWQHSAFRFRPQNMMEEQKNAYFLSFYPDGDYYFFIDEDFENGYLGHPWRQEVWVFGLRLCEEIEKVYQKLGWERLL